ncbi:hypothetical protein FOC4_g10004357 [Fusarium odoratissimum]|uniref:Uncharacterized protein n=1 Tax=Fusarium oxysporum f. sp. cubense (strain race 4) TaxID=2502994 RepID=N1S1Y2_FUSC4|nr:hypothetical protein FOC4_g10004357 [Fusarium odoratissimum]
MASSGSVFSETLQEITNTKLQELSKRRSRFEEAKAAILSSVEAEKDAVKRLFILSDGVKKCFSIKLTKENKVILGRTSHKRLEIDLKNLDRFLGQAKTDPSVSQKMLTAWEESLTRQLNMQALQYQYAWLYGELVTEWLSGDKEKDPGADVEMGEAFEDVGDQAKLQSRMDWEDTVFQAADIDTKALNSYLDHLFRSNNKDKKTMANSLNILRRSVSDHEASISTPNQFTVGSLKWIIPGLHSSDLLSNEKREVLRDFESNDMILKEIADVLNMRINALESWTWNSETPVPVSMEKKISGVFNIHMHEDLLQAIFLQYIGVKWSVFFKRAFKGFRDSGAWKSERQDIPRNDQRRLGYYLGPLSDSPCLQRERVKVNEERYFMAQLMNYEHEITGAADGEEEAEYERFAADKDEDDEDDKSRSPMALKQTLLHLLSTEITINTHLYGEMTAFHSVFDDWNPKIPHGTVFTILKFLGVSDMWLEFFKKFLEAPLKFVDDDDSSARKRRRGTPAAHVLSDVFGETTLFCLDFAVNQATSNNLWRMHDNFWFWSPDHKVAVKAWDTVDEFTIVTGVSVNPTKTGTVRIAKDSNVTLPIDDSLPEGEIRWGFLRLSPKTGRFEIDQKMVDSHIEELQKQLLDKRKSILGFIQAWNTYAATFFTSNFGKAANCFGREHVDNMLSTHKKIEKQVFAKLSAGQVTSVVEFLKREISQRFGIKDIPDGYLYFPMELGGLDLQSPFISLMQIHDEVFKNPSQPMIDFQEDERHAYEGYKETFLSGKTRHERYALDEPDWEPESQHEKDTFMSFEEFTRYREAFFFGHFTATNRLHRIFRTLMKRPTESKVETDDGKISAAMEQLRGESNLQGITGWWNNMDAYWTWVATFYGHEIVERFGRLNIVNTELLPIAMVSLFRDKRVKWQG